MLIVDSKNCDKYSFLIVYHWWFNSIIVMVYDGHKCFVIMIYIYIIHAHG